MFFLRTSKLRQQSIAIGKLFTELVKERPSREILLIWIGARVYRNQQERLLLWRKGHPSGSAFWFVCFFAQFTFKKELKKRFFTGRVRFEETIIIFAKLAIALGLLVG
jgi:hypothetical protein